VDIFAEAFAPNDGGTYTRTHNGVIKGIDPNDPATKKTLPALRMFAAEGFRCLPKGEKNDAGSSLNLFTQPRAFHTATLLPNGQVIFAGGLSVTGVAGSDGPSSDGTLYGVTKNPAAGERRATNTIEVYDPETGEMVSFTENLMLAPVMLPLLLMLPMAMLPMAMLPMAMLPRHHFPTSPLCPTMLPWMAAKTPPYHTIPPCRTISPMPPTPAQPLRIRRCRNVRISPRIPPPGRPSI